MLARIEEAFAERDATEAELRLSEERLRRFVADASHELRTPLAAVSAYAELFERGARERPEDLGRVMTGIRGETARMGRLVEDLLLLARLDEGRPLDASAGRARRPGRRGRRDGHGPSARAGRCASTPTEPVEVVGDAAGLRQVVDNLLANVRAHTPEGTAVTVRVARQGDEAVVEVADRGPGDDRRRGRPRVRAVLPGRPVPFPRPRRDRPRPVDRRRHRRRPRWVRDGGVGGRGGDDDHRPAAARPAAGRHRRVPRSTGLASRARRLAGPDWSLAQLITSPTGHSPSAACRSRTCSWVCSSSGRSASATSANPRSLAWANRSR